MAYPMGSTGMCITSKRFYAFLEKRDKFHYSCDNYLQKKSCTTSLGKVVKSRPTISSTQYSLVIGLRRQETLALGLRPGSLGSGVTTAVNEIFVSFSTMNGQTRTFYVPETRNNSAGNAYDGAHLPWRSPALYLFLGVAGMLALIGLASMVLLCFWWKIGGVHVEANEPERVSPGSVEGKGEIKCCEIDEEKVLVIMPGDEKPTFLAKELSSASDAYASAV